MGNIQPEPLPQPAEDNVPKQQADDKSNETTKPEASKTSDICPKSQAEDEISGESMIGDQRLKSTWNHPWNFSKRLHLKTAIKQQFASWDQISPPLQWPRPTNISSFTSENATKETQITKFEFLPKVSVDEEKERSVPLLHGPTSPPGLLTSNEEIPNKACSKGTNCSPLHKTLDGAHVEFKEVILHAKNLPQKITHVPIEGDHKVCMNEEDETFLIINPPQVQLEEGRAKPKPTPCREVSGIQKVETETTKKVLMDELSCSLQPSYIAQSNIPVSEHEATNISYADTLKQFLSVEQSDVWPVSLQASQNKEERLPLSPVLASNHKKASVKKVMVKTTKSVQFAMHQGMSSETSAMKVQENRVKTSPQKWEKQIMLNNGNNNTFSPALTFKKEELNIVWISPENLSNNQLQFSKVWERQERYEDFIPKYADQLYAQLQKNLQILPKFSFPSNVPNFSTAQVQYQETYSGNGQQKVAFELIPLQNQCNPKRKACVPNTFSLRNPEDKVEQPKVFVPKATSPEPELPEQDFNESSKLGQEQLTTNTTDTENAKIQQTQSEPSKGFQPTQTEKNMDILTKQDFAEEIKSSLPHSSFQTQLQITKTSDNNGMQLPGSMRGNGLSDMQAYKPAIQNESPKRETDMDAVVEEQRTQRWEEFFVESICTRKCRCKHRNGYLPPNVRKWLLVSENKLSEPIWITTLKLASSIVAGSRLLLDSCSALGLDDCQNGEPEENNTQD